MELSYRTAATTLGAVWLVVVVAGCPAHLAFEPPPPPTAPHAERASYFDAHRSAPRRDEYVPRTRLFSSRPTFTRRALHLRSGARVAWVEDLQPLVPPESETARAIDAAVRARGAADLVTVAGVGTAVVGLTVGAGLVVASTLRPGVQDDAEGLDPALLVGSGVVVVGALAGGAVAAWGTTLRDDEEDARTRAFRTFDASLREQLALPREEPSTSPARAATPGG